MNFNKWFNELEVFSTRGERFYENFADAEDIHEKWLKAAFKAGRESMYVEQDLLLQEELEGMMNVVYTLLQDRFELEENLAGYKRDLEALSYVYEYVVGGSYEPIKI